jgi:hypothetical protein
MRELGLVPCQPKPHRHSITEQGQAGPIPDLACRDFTAERPGEKMVDDALEVIEKAVVIGPRPGQGQPRHLSARPRRIADQPGKSPGRAGPL